jgi:hypothetical protein
MVCCMVLAFREFSRGLQTVSTSWTKLSSSLRVSRKHLVDFIIVSMALYTASLNFLLNKSTAQ